MSRTFAGTAAVVAKVRPKTSGTPTIPAPPTVISATSLIAVSPFTPPSVKGPLGVIRVPGRSGGKRVTNPQRDTALGHRTESLRMQNLGAKVRQFRCFAIGDFGDRGRARHQAGIGCHQAVHIRPDGHLVGVESSTQDRRRIIRASASERCEHTLRGSANEAGHHGNDSLLQERAQARFAAFSVSDPSSGPRSHGTSRSR